MAIEMGLTIIVIALAFCLPRLGFDWFSRIERAAASLFRRRGLSVAVVAASALLLRLAILPVCPIPHPFVPDDFSFLLASDTFASGKLTNPTPAMWIHFESIHITMNPTYMSMYFPSTGLILAASKVLVGNPWYGILFANVLMCGSICWALQAWLPPAWALLGGILSVLRLGLFSYWINTYSGGGAIAALGGALVLGSLPRLMKTARVRDGMLLALGIVLLGVTRPYEGLLLCIPTTVVLGRWALFGKKRPSPNVLIRRAAAPLALIIVAGAWMGYYDYRVFGSPLKLPYTVNRATYAVAPYYVWQSQRPEPVYHHAAMKQFYYQNELSEFEKIHSLSGFIPRSIFKAIRGIIFFAGVALLPPLFMLRRVLLDRRPRFLVISIVALIAGMGIEIYMIPHYLAPFTGVVYAIGLQAMRHMRQWSPGGQPVGLTLQRLCVTLCFLLAGLRLFAEPLHLRLASQPASDWTDRWYGPGHYGAERAQIESRFENFPEKQLILVRYSPNHNPFDEWVYNRADIDNSKVIWAREMNPKDDLELINYYRDRKVWLVEPDTRPANVSPYLTPDLKSLAGKNDPRIKR